MTTDTELRLTKAERETLRGLGQGQYVDHDCPEHGTCRHHCSPWAEGPSPDGWYQHLVLANPRPLATPVPAKGRLGLWRPDEQLRAAIEEQLGVAGREEQ